MAIKCVLQPLIDLLVDKAVLLALILVYTVAEMDFTVVGVFGGDIDAVRVFIGDGMLKGFLLRAAFGTDVGILFCSKFFFVATDVARHFKFSFLWFSIVYFVILMSDF